MFEAPPPTPAQCEIRIDFDEAQSPCQFRVMRRDDIVVVSFDFQSVSIIVAGISVPDGVRVAMTTTNDLPEPVRADGVCAHSERTRALGCVWTVADTEYQIIARY